ncbi:MAG: histidine kinase, partial [Actinobacteria bacterium]|nr:histidine kinase [Actinomycetota bacterium]
MTRCADGLARGGHVEDTAARAAQRALDGLQGRAPDVATIFIAGSAPEEAESALLKAAEVIGAQTVIGCTSDGVVAGTHTSGGEPAVSVWAASIPGARIRSFHLEVIRTQDSLAVVGMPQRREDDKVALMLADPWS